jgi:hypothetical protein
VVGVSILNVEGKGGDVEAVQVADQGVLQLAFRVLVGQIQEVEAVAILDGQDGLGAERGRQGLIEAGLVQQVLLVAPMIHLVLEHGARPTEADGGAQVDLALQVIPATGENHEILRPAYFSHQRQEFWLAPVGGSRGGASCAIQSIARSTPWAPTIPTPRPTVKK